MMILRIVDINNKIYFIGYEWFIEYIGEVLTTDESNIGLRIISSNKPE